MAGMGSARMGMVWAAVQEAITDEHAQIVDIGGGTGGFAVPLAELGHRVLVVDPNPDALAALARRAAEAGVTHLVTAHQGDVGDVSDLAKDLDTDVDLVLCHEVLEVLDDPAAGLDTIVSILRPGGTLSLVVAGRHAAVVARAMAGHFQQARALLDDSSHQGQVRRFTPDEIMAMLAEAGLVPDAIHAARVFTDLVPGALVDSEPGAAQALLELEQAVFDRPEYLALATHLHVLAHPA